MATNKADGVAKAAKILRDAYDSGKPCPPVRDILGGGVDAAYAVKNANTEFWLGKGRRLIGRKIGVSSKAAQARFGAHHPDFGMLFADMVFGDGQEIAFSSVLQPRVEAEVAFCVGDNLDVAQLTISDMMEAVDYVVPAIEVACSRIADWDIKAADIIADNGSAGAIVLGTRPVSLDAFDHRLCGMVMMNRGQPVSLGAGASSMGNPLNSLLWIARKMVEIGRPLMAGDIVMSGALGPMVPAKPGEIYEARISGLGSVRAVFSS